MIRRIIKFFIAVYYKFRFVGKCKINACSNIILRKCSFEGNNFLGERTYLSHTSLGYCTYIGFGSEFTNCVIGKYCSIGNNVRVVSADHPTYMGSTFPGFFSDTYRVSFVKKSKYTEHIVTENGYECEIGNDVWIGDNVLIKGGIKIGNGAVIGMGSVVLKDVEPYSIVAGLPAKEIRKRFDEKTIDNLETIKWWDKSPQWVENHADDFECVEQLIENIMSERS